MIYALYALIYILTVFVAAGMETSIVNSIGRRRMRKGDYYCNLSSSICSTNTRQCNQPSHQTFPATPEGMFIGHHPWWFAIALIWPIALPIMVAGFIGVAGYKFVALPLAKFIYYSTLKGSTYLIKEVENPRENVKQIN